MPCQCEKQSFLDSYNLEFNTLKQQQPDLSDHELRVGAAQKFRPKFRYLREASKVENSGSLEYVNGEFILTSEGKIVYPQYGENGTFAEQLHLAQLEQTPDKYSVTDHQTTLLMQRAFAEGATVVRTSYSREGKDNRDILEYRYDRSAGKGVVTVVNTAPNGQFHAYRDIKIIAREKSLQLKEISPSDKVSIFTDVQIDLKEAQKVINTAHTVSLPRSGHQSHRETYVQKENSNKVIEYKSPIQRDSSVTRVEVHAIRDNKKAETRSAKGASRIPPKPPEVVDMSQRPPITEIIGQINRQLERQKTKPEKDKLIQKVEQNRSVAMSVSESSRSNTSWTERETIKVPQSIDQIRQKWQENQAIKQITAFAAETKVGVGAALFGLNQIRKEAPQVSQNGNKEEKNAGIRVKYWKERRLNMRRSGEAPLELQRKRREAPNFSKGKQADTLLYRLPLKEIQHSRKEKTEKKNRGQEEGTTLSQQIEMKHSSRKLFERNRVGREKMNRRNKERFEKRRMRPVKENQQYRLKSREQKAPLTETTLLKKREKRLVWQMRRWQRVIEKAKEVQLSKEIVHLGKGNKLRLTIQRESLTREKKALSPSESLSEKKVKNTLTKKEKRLRTKELAAKFAVAWIIWILVTSEKRKAPQPSVLPTTEKKFNSKEALDIQEPRPWILLSIIWYLSMLREQGKGNHQIKKSPKKPNAKVQSAMMFPLPAQGIIFSNYS